METILYKIKVPTSSLDKKFISSILYSERIIEACKDPSQYMEITNLVILDKDMRICPVVKTNNVSESRDEDDE